MSFNLGFLISHMMHVSPDRSANFALVLICLSDTPLSILHLSRLGWSALWEVNLWSEMFGWKYNLLRPVFFVVHKGVVQVGRIDVGETRAFVKNVAKIDPGDVEPVFRSRFNYCPSRGSETAGCASTGDALSIFV
jgi:hypothetical protein